MDFDFSHLITTPEERALTVEAAHAPAIAAGANCHACPLHGCERGPVMPQVKANARLAVIIDAPSMYDVDAGSPATEATGRILNECLTRGGVRRDDATVTSVLLCQPPEDITTFLEQLRRQHDRAVARAQAGEGPMPPPLVLPTDACRARLDRDLKTSDSTVELAVGNQALMAVARHHGLAYGKDRRVDEGQIRISTLKKQHGAPVVLREGKVILGTYPPTFAFRANKHWMPVIKRELTRAASLAARGGVVNWTKPPYNIDPTIEEVEAFADAVVAGKHAVTLDIETGPSAVGLKNGANTRQCLVRCVGLAYTDTDGTEHVIVVPFRNMDGSWEWDGDADTITRAILAVRRVTDSVLLVMQNGSFDTSVMLRTGLMTDWNKTWFDTMLAHHDTDANDLPHGLGFITSEWFEAPHHKEDADHKVVDNVGYPRLKMYNGDDLLTTMRASYCLAARIQELGTGPQFQTDTKLAPRCRDMGDLGLVIHEPTRRQLAKVLAAKREAQRTAFQYQVVLSRLTNYETGELTAHGRQAAAYVSAARLTGGNDAVEEAQAKVVQDAGGVPLNPNSVPKLREWLFVEQGILPLLNTDQYEWGEDEDPSTSSGALLKIQEKGDVIQATDVAIDALLEYRAYDKLYGTYVADKKGRIQDVDWTQWGLPADPYRRILHTIYKLQVIPSGRLSTQPAIQNWPALGKANMRTMVVSPPGHCLVGADYDQLELRIYAAISGDKLLLQAFSDKRHGVKIDPHSLNAAALLARTEDEIWDVYDRIFNADPKTKKYWRTVAKRFCYLETYGGEEDKLFQVMSTARSKATGKKDFPNLKEADVKKWHERWHKLHPETKQWQEGCQHAVHEHGFVGVCAMDYRKRFFLGGVSKKNAPPNHTIQGFAASVANLALLRLADAIPHRGWSGASGLCLQVHDYIGAYVPRERAAEAREIFRECMRYEFRGMPFTCTPEVSERWSDQG